MPKDKVQKVTATELKYTFRSDVLFKMLFRQYQHLLKRLVAVLLEIPLESITTFRITNTEMPPEEIGKKFCRLQLPRKGIVPLFKDICRIIAIG